MVSSVPEGPAGLVAAAPQQARPGPPQRARRPFLRQVAGGLAFPVAAAGWSALGSLGCGRQPGAGARPGGPAALPPKVVFVVDTSAADHARYWRQFIAWFEQEHQGTAVEAILPPGEGPYDVKVTTLLAGGTIPDLFHLNNRFVYDFARRGVLQPLDALLPRVGVPVPDIIPGVLLPYRLDNALYGIPRDNATSVVYYNRDLLAAAGAREPDTRWTWDDYLELARKLTIAGTGQFGSTFPPIETPQPADHLSILRSFGGDWFDAALRSVVIGRPAAQRAFQFVADLRLRHHVAGRPEELAAGDQLLTQHAALAFKQQGYVQTVKRAQPAFQWDMAPIPQGPAGRVNVVGTTGYCIPRQAQQAAAGAVLLAFLLGERVQRDMMSEGRWTTPRKSLLHYAAPGDGQPGRFKEALLDPLLAAQGVVMPAGFGDMQQVFGTEMRPVWVGDRALPEAIATVQDRWTQLLHANQPPAGR